MHTRLTHHAQRPGNLTRLRFVEEPVNGGTPGAQQPRTFTQEEVTALLAREKDQGKNAGANELLAKITGAGFDGLDGVLTLAKQAQETEDAAKTEAQRERDAAAADRAEAAKDRQAAAELRHTASLTAALTTAGAANVTIAARAIDVPVGATPEQITAAIDKLKTDAPGLFTAAPVPGVDPGQQPGTQPTAKAGAAGKAEAERRFGAK